MSAIRRKIYISIIVLVAVLPLQALSVEKEIKIGYSFPSGSSSTVVFYFNVPVTNKIMSVINKQAGVNFTFNVHRYDIGISIAEMFNHKEVINNIIKALEKEIFMGKTVKAYPVK